MLSGKNFKHWQRCVLLMSAPAFAFASDVESLTKNPQNWAMQAGDMANQRYSELKQINKDNVKKLQVAWTFSTGVLRGHEGGAAGDRRHACTCTPRSPTRSSRSTSKTQKHQVEVRAEAGPGGDPVMCCDTVNRGVAYADGKIFLQQADTTLVALDAKTGKELWKVKNGDPKVGETATPTRRTCSRTRSSPASAAASSACAAASTAYDINTGKQVWKAFSTGPDDEMLIDPAKTMTWTDGKMAPVGKDSSLKTWKGDQWKIGGGTTWGWYSYDPALNLMYYGTGNPQHLEPAPAARRQQVVDDDLRARPRHRRWRSGSTR